MFTWTQTLSIAEPIAVSRKTAETKIGLLESGAGQFF